LQLKKQKFKQAKQRSRNSEAKRKSSEAERKNQIFRISQRQRKKSLSFSISIVPNFKDVDNIGAAITNFSGILKNLLKFRRDVPGNFTKICFQKWTI